jgi:hypothetical protein
MIREGSMADGRPKASWFQFRLRTLFIVCALAAIGVWVYRWVQWPSRTLQEFGDLIEQKRYEGAAARLEFEHGYLVSPGDLVHRVHVAHSVVNYHCQPRGRSVSDLIDGRQVYDVVGNQACFVDTGSVNAHFLIESITLERGKIRFHWRGPMPGANLRYENGEWIRDKVALPWSMGRYTNRP